MRDSSIHRLHNIGILSDLDVHFARFIGELAETESPDLLLAAALLSSYTRGGHICLDLTRLSGQVLIDGDHVDAPCVCPKANAWQKALKKYPVVGQPGDFKPLILDKQARLYLFRYWDYQQKIAEFIRLRVLAGEDDIDEERLKKSLEKLFGTGRQKETDWQRVAAIASVTKKFCVISGGPGTGKTSTIAKILALIIEQRGVPSLRIALAAPTGKAAARLQEAIKASKEKFKGLADVRQAIPEEASTIHRLLGSISGSPYFRYNSDNRLPVDIVVVDEASMVDLALMSKLVQALHAGARLILLGDKDQLASVEAGAVLGDICDTGDVHQFTETFKGRVEQLTGKSLDVPSGGKDPSPIRDCIVQLQKNFRFGAQSGIGAVSRAVNAGDADLAMNLLDSGKYRDLSRKDLMPPHLLPPTIRDKVILGYGHYLQNRDVERMFDLLGRFRILCALREGPYGVRAVNAVVEQILKAAGALEPGKTFYHGRPILITSNDYNLRLFNGDVGIILQDPEAGNALRAFFLFPDGSVRKFHPVRLPEHETVYAMTVHKSQGSEFDELLLILPDRDYPVLTRELVYTAITRARNHVEIWAPGPVFRTAIQRRIERMSGLRQAVWGE